MSKKKSASGALSGGMPQMDRSYQDESDHRTLSSAAEIQQDPSRMAGVRRQHRKVKKSMSLVQRQMMSARKP